jgi:hypothetical protein
MSLLRILSVSTPAPFFLPFEGGAALHAGDLGERLGVVAAVAQMDDDRGGVDDHEIAAVLGEPALGLLDLGDRGHGDAASIQQHVEGTPVSIVGTDDEHALNGPHAGRPVRRGSRRSCRGWHATRVTPSTGRRYCSVFAG